MASLDKLASMDGWDVGEDVTDGSVGRPTASVTRPQCILKDAVGGAGPAIGASATPRGSEGDDSSLHNRKGSERPQSSEYLMEQLDRVEVQADGKSDPTTQQSVQALNYSVRSSSERLEQLDLVEVQAVGSQSVPSQSVTTLKKSSSVPLAFGMTSQMPDEALTNPGDLAGENKGEHNNTATNTTTTTTTNNNNSSPISEESLPCKHTSGKNNARAAAKLDPQTDAIASQEGLSSSPNHHLIGSSRKGRGVGSDISGITIAWGSGSGGGGVGGDVTLDGGASEVVVANLKASLRKEQEERARQEKRREVFEEQARAAYASLEAKSKRAEELENRVRVLTMRMSLASGISGGGGSIAGVNGGLYQSSNRCRRARSMSPVSGKRNRARETAVYTEKAEREAQMAVIADATETAREEAQTALDVVEGFAALNRKLVDELRSAVSVRDDLLERLNTERGCRRQLEREVTELLAGGMALAVAEKEHELEVRYEKQHQDTTRAAALRSKMEEEYRCALKSSSQERARLESWVESLERELLDARHSHALRYTETGAVSTTAERMASHLGTVHLHKDSKELHKQLQQQKQQLVNDRCRERVIYPQVLKRISRHTEQKIRRRVKEEGERAAMGSEEVGSIRAGLAPRTKRLGHDQSSFRLPSGKNAGGGRRRSSGGWREAKQGRRIEMQRRNRGDHKKGLLATLNSKGPFHGSRAETAVGSGLSGAGFERRKKIHDGSGTIDKADASASSTANVGGGPRSTSLSSANRAGDPFVGIIGSTGKGDGGLGCEVYAAAVESVEMFLGDLVPAVHPPPLSARTVAAQEKGGGPAASSRWKAIGQGGRLSSRALAMCAKEADTTAKVEAHARLCSLINGSAHALSSSWLFLLSGEATTPTAASGGEAVSGSAIGDVLYTPAASVSSDATRTVPIVAVRRLAQTCGIVRSSAGGPTLAHADMQLRRNTIGKGRLGYREYFKTTMSLVKCRFAGESKESALEQLSIMLQPALVGASLTQNVSSRQVKNATVGTAAAANSVESADPVSAFSLEGMNVEDMLDGAERVLKRDRRALEAIFSHYATVCSPEAGASSARGKQVLQLAALTSFCKDFELTPGLLSRENAHRIYVQLVYPNESILTPERIAAIEGLSRGGAGGGRDGRGIINGGRADDVGDSVAPAGGLGLGLGQWMAWLGLVGIGCTWFDKQRGLYNTPTEKVLGLLQWMECSGGKARISSTRGAAVVPTFNLLPPQGTSRARR